MKKYIFYLIILSLGQFCFAQDQQDSSTLVSQDSTESEYENFWQYGKEVGLNATGLASHFVPFNLGNVNALDNQFIALKTKWYAKKVAFVINFGIDISDDDVEISKLFLSMGYERRRNISNKWKYTTGWEGTIFANSNDDVPFLGLSKPFGIEYHFFENFYLSTEARLLLGLNDSGPIFKLFYPNAIFFNMLLE